MTPRAPLLAAALLPAALLAAGCTTDPPCAGDPGAQPVDRFPAGWTFALPALDGAAVCADAAWELAEAPSGNANEIVGARFTPHVDGVHVFRVATTAEELRLTVIDPSTVPFQHHGYYPGTSIAWVAGAPWTADVYRATVTVVDPVGGGVEPIAVGPWPVAVAWREGMDHAVVAQRASDDLGLVDVASHRIVDAIPVGDEPANLVLSPDGGTAYVALAVSGQIAVVDLAARAVSRRIAAAPDVRALALSPDGATLYAARLRSRHPVRAPFPDTPVEDERDIVVIDVARGEVVRTLVDVGTTIRHLEVSGDGAVLYASRLRNDTTGNIADGKPHFLDEVVRFDAATGAVLGAADLGRQPSSGGMAVTAQGFALAGDRLWIAAESSDLVLALDATTLAEVARAPAAGRPRAVIAAGGAVYAHGPQGFVVTALDGAGAVVAERSTGADPRPPAVARGQRLFTGAGQGYGADHACHSCHAEGTSDGLVWKVGRGEEYGTPRPLFWLEGTAPLGWPAYLSDVRNWGYEGGSTTGTRPTTAEAEDLGAFLAALMPPPPANDLTGPGGALSAAAERGRALFEGDGGCTNCHRPPLFTTRRQLPDGVTPGKTDIPSLVGAYRHGVWFKNGEARSLRDAVAAMAAFVDADLDDADLDDVTRYVAELTGRDFFVLRSEPARDGRAAAADRPVELTFSLPVWDDPANRARIHLRDAAGAEIATTVSVDGRRVVIAPAAALRAGAEYRVELDAGLESFDQRRVLPQPIAFTVAAAPALRVEGAYTWTFDMPVFDPVRGFDPSRTQPLVLPLTAVATPSGVELTFDLGLGLTYTRHAVVDGDRLRLPAMPVPVGPTLADATLDPGALLDDDGDGRADRITGTLTFTGPGFALSQLSWRIGPVP
jgi:mono/diheme cytochrome c family protein